MTALRPQCLRHLTGHSAPQLRRQQRRWARVLDVRFVATQQAKDRILERYREQLQEKAKQHGIEDIEQLKEAYKDRISSVRKQAFAPNKTTFPPPSPSQSTAPRPQSTNQWSLTPPPPAQPLDQLSPSSPHFKPPGVKTLSSYLDITKTMDLPVREIEALWRLRHAGNDRAICATVPANIFSQIYATARKHPQFILPGLPTDDSAAKLGSDLADQAQDGAPIHFLQWTFPAPDTATVLFTHLAEYKLRGQYAQPHTTITHHTELAGPKGLVLCQGNVVESRGVSMAEAKWLMMCLQKFYNTEKTDADDGEHGISAKGMGKELSRKRRELMEQFSSGSSAFKIEELLDVAERLG